MTIGGISIILILGICNFLLILFQAASDLKLIKPKIGVHKKTGISWASCDSDNLTVISTPGFLGISCRAFSHL